MPANTPRGYTYPLYGDTQDFPTQMQDYANDVDADVQLLVNRIAAAYDRPSVRIVGTGNVVVAPNVNVTLTFTAEQYDNNNMADLGVNNQIITLNSSGIYLITGAITYTANGNATRAGLTSTLVSSAAVVPIPARKSVRDTQNFSTTVHVVALHQALVADNITLQARHNSPANITVTDRHLSATKITAAAGGF